MTSTTAVPGPLHVGPTGQPIRHDDDSRLRVFQQVKQGDVVQVELDVDGLSVSAPYTIELNRDGVPEFVPCLDGDPYDVAPSFVDLTEGMRLEMRWRPV